MPQDLTPKQEAFCLEYMRTSNASEAYRKAYSTSNMKDATINREAHELLLNRKVTARLAEMRAPALEAAQITLAQHLKDLKELRDKAASAEKYGPAIAAEVNRGKASGLYVEKIEHTGNVTVTINSQDADI